MKEIALTNGGIARVDDEDFERLARHRWSKHSKGYAQRVVRENGKQRCVLMHREVLNAPPENDVDHRDLDRLNNVRRNLRQCTPTQNLANQVGGRSKTSRFKGVRRPDDRRRWRAAITLNRKRVELGAFEREEDAARAYDTAARRLFGEFARTNFP